MNSVGSPPVNSSQKFSGSLNTIYELLKPKSITEIVLFILLMTAIYIITALLFYNQVQIQIRTKSQCYLANKSVTSSGAFTATAQNSKGSPLYTVSYSMPSKSFEVDCACPTGNVTNTFPDVDVYNLKTQKAMRLPHQICACDKQYYVPGYDSMYYSGYPGVTRFMNTASTISDPSKIQKEADTSFFQAALNPNQYFNTY